MQRKLESQLASVRAETDAKRSQIVSSPSRVRDELDAATRASEEAQGELASAEDERRALTRRLEVVRKAEKDVGKAIALLGEVEAEIARLKAVSKAGKQRAAEVAAAEGELAELQATSRQLEESIRSKDERLGQLRSEFDSRAGSADRESVSLRQELSSLQQQLADARQSRADAEIRRKELDDMVRGERPASARAWEARARGCRDAQALRGPRTNPVPCLPEPPPPHPRSSRRAQKERGVAQHTADMADMTASVKSLQEAVTKYHASLFKKVAEVAAAGTSAAARARAAAASAHAAGDLG